jgi:hypothetical protein
VGGGGGERPGKASTPGAGTSLADAVTQATPDALAEGLTTSMQQLQAKLAQDQAFADAAGAVGKLAAQRMAAGWQSEIAQTPWAANMVAEIYQDLITYFETRP